MCAGAAGPRRSCSTARGTSTCAVKGRSLAAATATAAWPGRVAPRQPTLGLERPRTWAARSQQRPSLPGSRAGAFNTLAVLARPRLRLCVVFAPSPVEAEASVQRCHLPRRRRARPPAAKGRWQRVEHGGPAKAAATRSVLTGERLCARRKRRGVNTVHLTLLASASAGLLPHGPSASAEAATSPHGRRLTRREASQEPGRQEARGLHRRRGQVLAAVQAGAARGRLLPARRTSCVGPARCADPLQLHVRGGAAELRDRVGDLHAHRGGPGAARVRWRPGVRDLLRR